MTDPNITYEDIIFLLYGTLVGDRSAHSLPYSYFSLSSRNRFTISIAIAALGKLSLLQNVILSDPNNSIIRLRFYIILLQGISVHKGQGV